MDKKEFTNEFKELLSSMSQEEIERTLNALNGCKSAISKKINQEKGEQSRLLVTVGRNESELYYTTLDDETGVIKAIGASILTSDDFDKSKDIIPDFYFGAWWLYEKPFYVSNNYKERNYNPNCAYKIRPVIIIDEITGNPKRGETIYINDVSFTLLSPRLLIKNICFEDRCTYMAENYESSVLKMCVDGWYMKLVKENKNTEDQIAG